MPKKTASSKSHYRTYFLFFLAALSILIAIKLFTLYKTSIFLANPWRKSVVFYTNPLVLVTLAQDEDDTDVVITIPLDITATVPFGYGQYRLEVVKRLGELEKKPELLLQTLEDMFGITIDAWVSNDVNVTLLKEEDQITLEDVKKAVSSLIFAKNASTRLNILDRLILLVGMFNLKSQTALTFDLDKSAYHLVEPGVLPDGSSIRTVNEFGLDQLFEHTFEDPAIGAPGFSVQVLNGTETFGLGQRFGRKLSIVGFKVTQVGNDPKKLTSPCLIKTSELNAKGTQVSFIASRFGCEIMAVTSGLSADAVVTIGEPYGQRWATQSN